jgi:hypothetical protein
MKNNLSFLFFGLALITACQQPKPVTVDLQAEKARVNALLDKFEAATLTDTLASLMTEDALVIGTAPSELMTKKETVEIWSQYYSGKVPEHTYINERILKMAADGNSATAIEEYMMPAMSPVIPARNTIHLVKSEGKWMIDFISSTFILKNEDVPKIDRVLNEEQKAQPNK